MEGECILTATHDSLGHISLSAVLWSEASLCAPCWKASVSHMIEAGQLNGLQRDVEEFFAYVPKQVAAPDSGHIVFLHSAGRGRRR